MKHILLIAVVLFNIVTNAQTTDSIHLNQLGYYPRAQKIAVLVGIPGESEYYIIDAEKNDTAWNGKSGALQASKNSSLKTSVIDFTALQKEGNYNIVVPQLGHSYPFAIKSNVLAPVAVSSMKAFYYQRVSMPLDVKFAGQWEARRSSGYRCFSASLGSI